MSIPDEHMINAYHLEKAFPWKPTAQQQLALQNLSYFLSHRDRFDGFVLRGYAGTGKTTLISALVKSMRSFKQDTVLLAPTGRAAKVMRQYAQKNASTIHRKIYRKKSAASPDFSFKLAPNLHKNTLFIIDEASMISDESAGFHRKSLLADLIEYVSSGENCNFLFVGDNAQLPPIGLVYSPALDVNYLERNYQLKLLQVELTEVVRQAQESGILYNATIIRHKIEEFKSGIPDELLPHLVTNPFKDIYKLSGERLIEGLHYAYDKFGLENSIVICRSNKSANLYNKHIRHQLLFRDEELSGGDQVMVVKNNYYWLNQDETNKSSFIANGDLAEVRRVRNIHEQYGFRFADVTLYFPDFEDQEPISCRVLLDTLYVETPNLPTDQMKILYDRIMEDYQEEFNAKARHEKILLDPYYNALQIKFSMAITCHKAQGGQWDVVFIDQGYINDEQVDKEFLQWLYTAITRAKKEAYLVNFHPLFFDRKIRRK